MTEMPLIKRTNATGLAQVFLLPGKMYCSAEPSLVTTVLGSCVAVCLWDRVRRISGINHFVLPSSGGLSSLRYGDVAIERLIATMQRLDCRPEKMEAKVFGGGAVLRTNDPDHNIGTRNVEVALAQLSQLAIPVVARRTGGTNGLTIRLFTASGDVLVRCIKPQLAAS
jgi:chemotaxis protein CheD